MAQRTDSPILEGFAHGGFELRTHQWFPYRGAGPITLTDAGVRWVQHWPRFWPRWQFFLRRVPQRIFIPIDEIRSVRCADNPWAPILWIETDDGHYYFRVGRGFLMLSARRIGQEWLAAIETRLAARDEADSESSHRPGTP